jgi:hypothetical protein
MFVDLEGEDEGPKPPIYKPPSITPSDPSHRAACIFLHDIAEEGANFARTSLHVFVNSIMPF